MTALDADATAPTTPRPDLEQLHDSATAIADQVLQHLDSYLLHLESTVQAAGGTVHWARDAAEADRLALDLVQRAGATEIVETGSALTAEIGLDNALATAGIVTYTIDPTRERRGVTAAAEPQPRAHSLTAKVGITGANFLVAESGTVVVVESDGSGRMCLTLPEILICVAGVEKIVPTWRDLEVFLELPSDSAAGDRMPPYVSTWSGITAGDGPREFHLVLVDNGRILALARASGRKALRRRRSGVQAAMTGRDAILDLARRARPDLPGGRRNVAAPRDYLRHAPGISNGDRPAVLALFAERSKHCGAQVYRVPGSAVPEAISAALTLSGARTVVLPEGVPASWPAEWSRTPGNRVLSDEPQLTHPELADIDAVITTCAAAIADSATVVLDGGEGQGRRAPTLIPDCHICVVHAEQVASAIPEVIAVLDPGRPLTWFSGPPTTADSKGIRVPGGHGPRRLVLILVESE
ncbi:MAG: lutB [Nocardia sp.]|uniref:LUD domain-containing protein n=1 Tax=Nocardia sp. TaxID=1821 RepID=UPI0026366DE5|nr:LUD domain-containing protein [Nocardia sp.]MCU1648692.1 lutB [Nocardia sp.]